MASDIPSGVNTYILVLIKVFWFIQDPGILYFYGSTMAVMVVIEPQAVITMLTRAHWTRLR